MTNLDTDATGVKHTPGPWIIEDDSEGAIWVASENPPPREQYWTTAKCFGPNARANARLIAAAPDLLAAAIDLIKSEETGTYRTTCIQQLRAAIAKAEGQS